MKIVSQVSRRIGEKEYNRYWVIIPPKIIKQLKWKKNKKLDFEVFNNKLIITKKVD